MNIPPRVLITRPAHQAQALADTIQHAGGQPVLFPTVIIKPLPASQSLPPADIVIFTSINAVQSYKHPAKIAAIGAATAQELIRQGYHVDYVPDQFNSEGLLALPEFQQVHNKTIIIFKGLGGRDLLTLTLRERGAQVIEIDVYQRCKSTEHPLWQANDIDIIISTSQESLVNLIELIDLREKPLIVISERMVRYAQQLGFTQPPIVADNASNDELVTAFIHWRNSL